MLDLKREPKFPVTRGAELLRAFLRRTGQSVPKFCEANDIDRILCQRAMNGDRKRISVDFALAIQRATGGDVPVDAWSTPKRARRAA